MESKFRIIYDDQPNEVVDKISAALAVFNLEIVGNDADVDGYVDYAIVQKVELFKDI